jgi:(2S)-methylsuccinyl-CoA dehydrogenase
MSPREPQTTAVSGRVEPEARAGRGEAIAAVSQLFELGRGRLRDRVLEVGPSGARPSTARLDERQLAAHALSWMATEIEAARQLSAWAERTGGDLERRIADAFTGEMVRGLPGGIRIGPCETVGLSELEISAEDVQRTIGHRAVAVWARDVASGDALCALARAAHGANHFGDLSTGGEIADEETLAAIRQQMRRFAEREVAPIATEVHRRDLLIPIELVYKMAVMGVFGMTVPESFGGQGLGKLAMCVATEELSRVHLGVGSLATRAEIAAELVLLGGTMEQRREWLPKIASGEVIPCAVFTEPDHGSDLAHIKARAERGPGGGWVLFGHKTWITHAARADLMTVLLRTSKAEAGYEGLSMFLVPKQRGTTEHDFPDEGLSGAEIPVLGYRGMKEYELSFDGFSVPAHALLGAAPGMGFKQLMATFETARIQTAARGVGVAQAALEAASRYAHEREQFGQPIAAFPRVARKLGRMTVLVAAARQLTYYAARAKDAAKRCDLEAGMAKLLSASVAWECADACVQVHGGQGYAEECVASRLLVDARVLSIFEGASEIQAQVIARRLLEA